MKAIRAIAVLLAFTALRANAAQYTFTTLPSYLTPLGINNAGEIVGYLGDRTGYHGFIDHNGTIETLTALGDTSYTFARGINNAGQIVGYTSSYGFLYSNGAFTQIDVPPSIVGNVPFANTRAMGINDNGVIVGYIGSINPASNQGFVYQNGVYAALNVPGAVSTDAFGINNAGVIVGVFGDDPYFGNHGFMYDNGTFTTLDFPGAYMTVPYGINNAGQIVGTYFAAGSQYGFIYGNGTFESFDVPTFCCTSPFSVNDARLIVGFYADSMSQFHGFVASPVPLPEAVWLLGSALGGLGLVRRRG